MTPESQTKSTTLKRMIAQICLRCVLVAAIIASVGFLFFFARPSAQGAPSVGSIEIYPKAYSLNPCETRKYSVTVKDTAGEEIKDISIKWQSTNAEAARVNDQGVATGLSAGYTFIRAIAGGVKSNAASLFIRDKGVPRRC